VLLVHQQKGEKTYVRLRFCQQGRRRPNRVVVGRLILWRLCGRQLRRVQSLMKESLNSTETIGISLAQQLLAQGADKILEQLQSMESENGGS
jgi:hypothetical protein